MESRYACMKKVEQWVRLSRRNADGGRQGCITQSFVSPLMSMEIILRAKE